MAGLVLSAAALADVPQPALRFMLTGGFTAGGDRLTTAHFTDGSNSAIRAGERLILGMGAYWRQPTSPVSAQLTYNYHADSARGTDGKITFDRWPVELLGHYHLSEQLFVGGGLRVATRGKLTFSIRGEKASVDLDADPGAVAELGWQPVPDLLFTLRLVGERYKSNAGVSFNGKHIGLTSSLVF